MDNRSGQNGVVTRLLSVLLTLVSLMLLHSLLVSRMGQGIWAGSAMQPGTNLVPNPGFEDPSPASWYNAGSSVGSLLHFWSAGTAHEGNHSLGILSYEAGSRGQWWSDPFAVQAGVRYDFSGWVRAASLLDHALLTLAFYSSPSQDDLVAEFDSSQVTGSSEWTTVTGSVAAPDVAQYARMYCELRGEGTAWFDDISVTPKVTFTYTYLPLTLKNFSTLCNGGFERGDFTCWAHGGELDQVVQAEIVYEGDHAAQLGNPDYPCQGGVPVGEAWVSQTFSVPSCSNPTLSFRYRIFSNDVLRDDKWDSFDVYVNGMLILRDGNTDWAQATCTDPPWDSGWKSFSYDLNANKGQSIQVSFHNVNRADHYYNTWTYIDQVEVKCETQMSSRENRGESRRLPDP